MATKEASTGRISEGSWEEVRFDLSRGKRKGVDALGRENSTCKAMAGWLLWLK